MDRQQKVEEVKALVGRFQGAKSVILADNKGLSVSEISSLRKLLKEEEGSLKIAKNRLAKIALKEANMEGLDDFFKGPTTIASSEKDPVAPAKILVKFAKDHEAFELKGGYMDGEVLDLNKLNALASLPSKEELFTKLLGCINNPATSLVNVIQAVPRSLVNVLNAIKDTKQ